MSLVLVIAVTFVALADAGYHYSPPSSHRPSYKPGSYQPGNAHHNTSPYDHDRPLAHSVSYKNYVYLRKDNPYSQGVSHAASHQPQLIQQDHNLASPSTSSYSQSLASSVAPSLSTGYMQSFPSTVNINYGNPNRGYAQSYAPINGNNDYSQMSSLPLASPSTSYGPPMTSSTIVSGSAQTVSSSSSTLNSGYSLSSSEPTGIKLQTGFVPIINSNSNSGHASSLSSNHYQTSTPLSSGLSNDYVQTGSTSSASTNYNNGYSQSAASASVHSGYSQPLTSTSNSHLSSAYTQSLGSSGSTSSNLNTGYSQPLSSSASVSSVYTPSSLLTSTDYNTGYSANSLSSDTSAYSDNYIPSVTTSGYSQASASSIGLNNDYSQTSSSNLISQANDGYSESFSSPSSISLNGGSVNGLDNNLSSQLPSSPVGTSLGIINAEDTTATSNFNSGAIENSSPVSVSSNVQAAPAIFKHIYFHVPPPEIEEQEPIVIPPPPKKNYKIIFIKVPSQESRANVARLQQMAQMQNAAVEHKTLIYVLVKKPENQQQVVIPKKTPSQHEVFFVKYNGNPLDLAAQVNEELDKTGSVQSIVPLQSGLVNGHK